MKTASRWLLAGYLLVLAFFAFRPFVPIPGLAYPAMEPVTNGVFRAGAALEDAEGAEMLLERLGKSGRMSLEILLKTDSLKQGGPARIVSFSRDSMRRNFTLGQSGNGLVFRLRTTETDRNGMYPSLLVPKVFDDRKPQHLAVTYDGAKVRLYIDGELHPSEVDLAGSFGNWGRNYLLTVGDEVSGGRPWSGRIERFSIYGRALGPEEVELLCKGSSVPGAAYVFQGLEAGERGIRPLGYRNLFVFTDAEFNRPDCVANIAGFVPLAALVWLALPGGPGKWRFVPAVLLPVLFGISISGAIELVQRHVDGRVPSILDLVYNLLGTLLGCVLLWWAISVYTRKKEFGKRNGPVF